jgi:hypothetical protein
MSKNFITVLLQIQDAHFTHSLPAEKLRCVLKSRASYIRGHSVSILLKDADLM